MFTKINARKRKYGFLTGLYDDDNIIHCGLVLSYLKEFYNGDYLVEKNFSYGKSELRIYTDDVEINNFIEMNFVDKV